MEDLIYAAGLFDGEGTVTLTKQKANQPFKTPIACMTSTSKELVDFMQQTFGGTLTYRPSQNANWQSAWVWRVSYDTALDFFEKIQPFVREKNKRRRIDLLLAEYKAITIRNGKYSAEQRKAKENFESRFFHPD